MRPSSIFLILFLYSITSSAKTKLIKPDEALFEQAGLLEQLIHEDLSLDDKIADTSNQQGKIRSDYANGVRESILEKELELYRHLIDSFPDSKLLFRAMNNKASVEYRLEDYEAAKKTYLKILNSGANDREHGGIGSGIMAEPYANYKNRAANTLATLALRDSNYKLAIHYLDETKKYPYRHFCGNAHAAVSIFMASQYAKCYIALREYDSAYRVMLPHIINNGLAGNSYLINIAYPALLVTYSKEELRSKFEEAFKNVEIKKHKEKTYEWETYTINYLGVGIDLPTWNMEFARPEEKEGIVQKIMTGSEFYKLLQ